MFLETVTLKWTAPFYFYVYALFVNSKENENAMYPTNVVVFNVVIENEAGRGYSELHSSN